MNDARGVSYIELLVVAALWALCAAGVSLIDARVPAWLAIFIGLPTMAGVMFVIARLSDIPMRRRNRRIHESKCESCLLLLTNARVTPQFPSWTATCTACGTANRFDWHGRRPV